MTGNNDVSFTFAQPAQEDPRYTSQFAQEDFVVLTVQDVLATIRKARCFINRRRKSGVYGTGEQAIRRLAHRLGAPIESIRMHVQELIRQGRAKFTSDRLVATNVTKTTARGNRVRGLIVTDGNQHPRPHRPQDRPGPESPKNGIPENWRDFDPSNPDGLVISSKPIINGWEEIAKVFEQEPSDDVLDSPDCLRVCHASQLITA
ncbi:MAG: hypothetical protein ABIQ64_03575 [Candidatus Saccharimonadales bacterium]